MTAKEYLQQPYLLDKAINAKLAHYDQVKALATKTTTVLTGMPGGGGVSDKVGDGVARLWELSREIDSEVDRYVDLKRAVANCIKQVGNAELRTVLEYRYLAYNSWEQIAVNMGYSYRMVLYIHSTALKAVENIAQYCT